jgi:shikimate 5-dehydrogenase
VKRVSRGGIREAGARRKNFDAAQENTMTSMLDRFRLDGQVAIITGSGRGIGAATALALADAGADVVISARTRTELEDTAAKVRSRGRRALVVPCDVLDAAQREALVASALEEFGASTSWSTTPADGPPRRRCRLRTRISRPASAST